VKSWTIEIKEGDYERTWDFPNPNLGNDDSAQAFRKTNYVYTDTPNVNDFKDSKDSWKKYLDVENKYLQSTSYYRIHPAENKKSVQALDWKFFCGP